MKQFSVADLMVETPPWPVYPTGDNVTDEDLAEYDRLFAERRAFVAQREALEDEIAEARARARRSESLPSDWSWPEDPRGKAWREINAASVRTIAEQIAKESREENYSGLQVLGRKLVQAAGLCCVASEPCDSTAAVLEFAARVDAADRMKSRASAGSYDAPKAARILGGD